MSFAPIVLFVYNRPWHTCQTVAALQKNENASESDLFIYADGAKSEQDWDKVNQVRKYIKSINGFKSVNIALSDNNKGLANSIVNGVTEVINKFGKVIVLEDDIVTSPGFLKYMNEALNLYEKEEKVMHISGYFSPVITKLPETFFYNQTSCWGWATWERAWNYFNSNANYLYNEIIKQNKTKEFNIDDSYPFLSQLEANINGNLYTWAIKWHASVFLNHGLCLHPNKSLVQNIGHDGTGENSLNSNNYYIKTLADNIPVSKIPLKESKKARKAMVCFNRGITSIFSYRIQKLLFRLKKKMSSWL